jgi:predicted cupin superfamily sugar epimerase
MTNITSLVNHYNLIAHPEGGYFAQTYCSTEIIKEGCLPVRFTDARPISTAIYFLLGNGDFSAFHKIKSDECWHFYAGQVLMIYVIQPDGSMTISRLGNNILNGEVFQYVVPAGCWFASEPGLESDFSFVGCTVAPGFDYADFELARAKNLIEEYPQHEAIIQRLCRI